MAREPMDPFDEAFKDWAQSRAVTSPDEAAEMFLRRLEDRASRRRRAVPASSGAHRGWRWANALATVLLATVVTLRFSPGVDPAPRFDPAPVVDPASVTGATDSASGSLEAKALPEDVVVMWLDAETPLYLTMKRAPPTRTGTARPKPARPETP